MANLLWNGMPVRRKSIGTEPIWSIVALLQELRQQTPEADAAMIDPRRIGHNRLSRTLLTGGRTLVRGEEHHVRG